jgi:hypothetical protein
MIVHKPVILSEKIELVPRLPVLPLRWQQIIIINKEHTYIHQAESALLFSPKSKGSLASLR